MDNLKNFIQKLSVVDFFLIIFATIVLTILLSNYFKICSFKCKNNEGLQSIESGSKKISNDIEWEKSDDHISDHMSDDYIITTLDGKPSLAFYYMNGCGYCNLFKPEWEKLKTTIENSELKNILILKANNCSENPKGYQSDVDYVVGFPTVLLTKSDGSKVLYEDYPRTHDSVLLFLKNNM